MLCAIRADALLNPMPYVGMSPAGIGELMGMFCQYAGYYLQLAPAVHLVAGLRVLQVGVGQEVIPQPAAECTFGFA